MKVIRENASDWGIDPHRIGIMGFSAGGHLASTVGTHFDYGIEDSSDPIQKISCHPDFMILMYPVISMSEDYMHSGSMKNLLGENPTQEQMILFSNEKQVSPINICGRKVRQFALQGINIYFRKLAKLRLITLLRCPTSYSLLGSK